MIALLLLMTAQAEVTVTHSIPLHHIAGETFYVDFQLFNGGQQPASILDIGTQRWQVEFQVQTPNGTQNIHSTKPAGASPTTVSLASRGLKEFRFEVPNSTAWNAGTIQLVIKSPLSDTPIEQAITVHTREFDVIDEVGLENALFTPLDTLLWHTSERHLFKGFDDPQYIATIQDKSTFGTSAHLGLQHHLFWMHGQSLTIVPAARDRLESPIQATIPWPVDIIHPLGQPITDANGQFLLPLWVEGKHSGTLYLLKINPQGTLSFRKLYTGTKPTHCATGISQANTPLVAFSTPHQAWLLSVTETGNSQVDSLPPKSTQIIQTPNATIEDLRFVVSDTQGLFISALAQKAVDIKSDSPAEWVYSIHTHSLQGSMITQPVMIQTSEQFSHITYLENSPYLLNTKGAWDSTGTLTFTGQSRNQHVFWRSENGSLYQYGHLKQDIHRNKAKKNLGGKGE